MPKNILNSDFLKDFVKIAGDVWLKGWGERNGGNLSYRLTKEEFDSYVSGGDTDRIFPLPLKAPDLAGESFLITGAGKYFRNAALDPESSLGIIKIDERGGHYRICWGLPDGARPTSELPAHLLTHSVRKDATNGKNRVVLHVHATNLIALSFVLKLDTKTFTKALWQMISECIIVFPEGIGVLPWMIPGSEEIGTATAELMKTHAMVLWPHHGVFGTGATLDEAFGLVDTAEKAAEILVKVLSMGGMKQNISDLELRALADKFGIKPHEY